MIAQGYFSKGRVAASLAGLAMLCSCVEPTTVNVVLDVPSPELYQHVATVDFSLHEVLEDDEEITDAQICLNLRREAVGSGFSVPPLRTVGPIEPCDLVNDQASVPDLPLDRLAYVTVLRGVDNEPLATGCEVRRLEEFGEDDTGARVLTIVTLSTPTYDTSVAGTAPPFADTETRCVSQ